MKKNLSTSRVLFVPVLAVWALFVGQVLVAKFQWVETATDKIILPTPTTSRQNSCGLLQPPQDLEVFRLSMPWVPYNNTAITNKKFVGDEKRAYFRRVHNCPRRYSEAYVDHMDYAFYHHDKQESQLRTVDTLLCEQDDDNDDQPFLHNLFLFGCFRQSSRFD